MLMGDYHLAPEKAMKIIGPGMTVAQKKAQAEAEALALTKGVNVSEALEQVHQLRVFSAAELADKNVKLSTKAVKMMGEECIISKKAAKLVGPPMSSNEVRINYYIISHIVTSCATSDFYNI